MQGIQQLQATFRHINISSTLRSDHIVLESSQNKTEANIREMITSAKFCPLISENKIGGNFIVSIVPYKIQFISWILKVYVKSSQTMKKRFPYFLL
jgi:predicted metalloenzyme YecM